MLGQGQSKDAATVHRAALLTQRDASNVAPVEKEKSCCEKFCAVFYGTNNAQYKVADESFMRVAGMM